MITETIAQGLLQFVGNSAVYPGGVTDGLKYPSIVYATSNYERQLNLDGTDNATPRLHEFDIDVNAKTVKEAETIAKAIFDAWHGFTGEYFGELIELMEVEIDSVLFERDIKCFVVPISLTVYYS